MKRRGFFSFLAGLFAFKPTTTLIAAGADACTTAFVPPSGLSRLDVLYGGVMRPEYIIRIRDENSRLLASERRFDPRRLPA